MKWNSYQKNIDKSVKELKSFLVCVEGYDLYKIGDVVNRNVTKFSLVKDLRSNCHMLSYLRLYIKNRIENANCLEEIEEMLIFYNIFIGSESRSGVLFKRKLLSSLLNEYTFDESLYCVVRHIVGHRIRDVEPFIQYISKNNHFYHQMMLKIHCIEEREEKAYVHLKVVGTNIPEQYQKQLYLKHPTKYSRTVSSSICSMMKSAYSN